MNEQDKLTRRKVVARLGATVATAAISPVFAAPDDQQTSAAIEDPTTKYPRPTFKSQSQP